MLDGLSEDGAGIMAYECNQDWACGIDYAFYSYRSIGRVYGAILYYINHSLAETCVSESASYHIRSCSDPNCNAYLRQPHVYDTYYPQSATHHRQGCSACVYAGGTSSPHIFVGNICKTCKYDKSGPPIFG